MRRRLGRPDGQASVELLASVPALVVFALVLFQLFAVGYAKVLAGNASAAGAAAAALGRDGAAAARAALPGWSRSGARALVSGGRVEVLVRPRGPLAQVVPGLRVRASAFAGASGSLGGLAEAGR